MGGGSSAFILRRSSSKARARCLRRSATSGSCVVTAGGAGAGAEPRRPSSTSLRSAAPAPSSMGGAQPESGRADEDTPALSEIRKACIFESSIHVGDMRKKCREFAKKVLGPDKKHVLDPNEDLAHFLWVGNYPDWCDEIMRSFRSHSHRRLNGNLLAHVRRFLKKEGRLQRRIPNFGSFQYEFP